MLLQHVWVLSSAGPCTDGSRVYGCIDGVFVSQEEALRYLEQAVLGEEIFRRLCWWQPVSNPQMFDAYDPDEPDQLISLTRHAISEGIFGKGCPSRPSVIAPDRLFHDADTWRNAGNVAEVVP